MNRSLATIACLAFVAWIASAAAADPPGAPADHFLAYKAKPSRGGPEFTPVLGLRLTDAIEDQRCDVTQARDLLVPVEADGQAIADAVTHLRAFSIRPSKTCSDDGRRCDASRDCNAGATCKRPRHQKRTDVGTVSSLGSFRFDTVKQDWLLLPSSVSYSGLPLPAPDPRTHSVDAYACYLVKSSPGRPVLPKGATARLTDTLTTPAKVFEIVKPRHLCMPVGVAGEGIKSPNGWQTCYKVRPARGQCEAMAPANAHRGCKKEEDCGGTRGATRFCVAQPKHSKRLGVAVNGSFGPLSLDTVIEGELCVPSIPLASSSTPTPTAGRSATPSPSPTATPTTTPAPTANPTPTTNGSLPPDPASIAPPLDGSVATTLYASTEFLHSGADPIQTGVAPGAIDPVRAAVLRGRVLDRSEAPMPGVSIRILDHPEFGQTLSRADGFFDLAVNGGGPLVVIYARAGVLPAQRQIDVPWQDFALLPDVVLVERDAAATTVELPSGTLQVARGSVVSDDDGVRRATVLFPAGVTAELVMPDGNTSPVTTLQVRATEYTVGPNGALAMPAELPPTSSYTYAVELSADEAIAAGAEHVRFSAPVVFYLENFVGFPVGTSAPVGSYDFARGVWVPSDNGRVVQILGVDGGLARVDTDGNGVADDDGIGAPERERLAGLYAVGQTLWRVELPHFSPWDLNWIYGPPPDAEPPDNPPPDEDEPECEGGGPSSGASWPLGPHQAGDPADGSHPFQRPLGPPDPNLTAGVFWPSDQTTGQDVPSAGPFGPSLHYRSDRAPGRLAGATLDIPLSGASIPASLTRIDLEVRLAGRSFKQSFAPAPNQRTSFTWDGLDVYGRRVQGAPATTVDVAYVYAETRYVRTPRLGTPGSGIAIVEATGRGDAVLRQTHRTNVGLWDARGLGLGGWTLAVHHAYDPVGRTVYFGDGSRARAREASYSVVSTIAGDTVADEPGGDGGPAKDARLRDPRGVAVGRDGSVYFTENRDRVRKIDPSGVISTVSTGLVADWVRVAPDGSLYVGSEDEFGEEGGVVVRITAAGSTSVVAGTGGSCGDAACGDGGAAAAAAFQGTNIAPSPTGGFYVAEREAGRVRYVGTDGIVLTIAGGGADASGEGIPATDARIVPDDIAVDATGALYVSEPTRIRRVTPNGLIRTVVGGGGDLDGEGIPGTQVQLPPSVNLASRRAIAIGPDGALSYYDDVLHRVRRLGSDGLVRSTIGRGGVAGFGKEGDGGPAARAQIGDVRGLAFGPDGSLYFSDVYPCESNDCAGARIRRIQPPLPGFGAGDVAIASSDGGELYRFDPSGRHLSTVNTLTGATRYAFTYDAVGRLAKITDGDGNETRVERDATGTPTAIVYPFGQRLETTVDADGFLASVSNPAGETSVFTYGPGGLLATAKNPRDSVHALAYDALGRVITGNGPDGSVASLVRTDLGQDRRVDVTTGLGRTTIYETQRSTDGDRKALTTLASGQRSENLQRTDGSDTQRTFTGAVSNQELGADPRFAMQAPIVARGDIVSPGGLSWSGSLSRQAALTDPADPTTLVSLAEQSQINGSLFASRFDAITRTFTRTSAEGRVSTRRVDAQGRVLQTQTAGLFAHEFVYDSRGRIASISVGSGPETRILTFDQGPEGHVDAVTDPLGRTLHFGRDAAGRIASVTLPDASVLAVEHDANGNVKSITPPGRPAHRVDYTASDLPERYRMPAVSGGGTNEFVYAYDLDRQLDLVIRPDGATLDFEYDAGARLSTLTTAVGQYAYAYDATSGNVASITAPGGETVAFTWDGGLLETTTWGGTVVGTVERTYDADLRVSALGVNGDPIGSLYDGDGLPIVAGSLFLTRDPDNGFLVGATIGAAVDAWTYNGFGERTGYTSSVMGVVYAEELARDGLGRVQQRVETVGGTTTTYDYEYDLGGRLAAVARDGVPIATYAYDANDNRTEGPGLGAPPTYDAQDRLLAYGGVSFAYSAAGELASRTVGGAVATYAHDELGNLRRATLPSGTAIDYVIDGRNRRIGKKIDGTLVQAFLYDDDLRVVAELDGTNAVVSRFVHSTGRLLPAYMIKGGATYRFVADHVGNPRLLVNVDDGTVAQRMDFDEFGNVTLDTNPGFQPFGFAGGLYDRQTKLVRFGKRDYDPEVGRFILKDPLLFASQQTNLYVYAGNDPLNFADPSGLRPCLTDKEKKELEELKKKLEEAFKKKGADPNNSDLDDRWQKASENLNDFMEKHDFSDREKSAERKDVIQRVFGQGCTCG